MLTSTELQFIQQSQYPLIKQSAIKKIKHLFEETAQFFFNKTENKQLNSKISFGENYLQMPYVVLDIPKLTSEKPHLQLRILFWWGHYFAIQYFINSKLQNCKKLILNLSRMPDWYVLTNNEIWNNNIEDACWASCSNLTDDIYMTLNNLEIIKICGLVAIKDYDVLHEAVLKFYYDIENFK
ncbi:MAG: hypothetical protein ACK4K9_03855 [Bacteroidia bacterium]